ncbi:MAG TPA: hypothetical protein EYP56_08330 [Planctomycetaceae bacterium]|nr:hypothetical protein [Planctomycetaceae bacterium]
MATLWGHWRNRVWAEATEKFRAGLRKVKPDVISLANTQYGYRSWYLAADLPFAHEDAVLSESRGLTVEEMAKKMTLGQALARGPSGAGAKTPVATIQAAGCSSAWAESAREGTFLSAPASFRQ